MKDFLDSLDAVAIGQFSLLTILSALLILIVAVILKRFILKLFSKVMEKVKLDASIKSFLNASINTILWIVIVLVTVDRLGIPVTSLVAILSVVGVALSLSLQSLLENIFAGITLLGTKPIQVGEYVEIGSVAGTVKKLSLFYAVLNTSDKKTVYIPNSTVTSSHVINHSDAAVRRVEIDVSASYDDEPDKVIASLIRAAKTADAVIDVEKEPIAFVQNYGNSSIDYKLYVFTPNSQFLSTKYSVTRRIYYAFREDGVTMTYDHLNLHIVESSKIEEA